MNDVSVIVPVSSWIAFASILAASPRVMRSCGWNVPSDYPLTHPFDVAKLIYSVYQACSPTSENCEPVSDVV